ncbi:Bacteriophage lambda tail assembly protein I [compost metagenome]
MKDGDWHVIRGPLDSWDADDEERLLLSLGEEEELHFVPAVKGAGNGGGVLSFIMGVVLFAAGVWFANPGLMGAGLGMMVGGIVQMTMKTPGIDNANNESMDDKASFLFAGPKNTSSQGVAIPRGYGRMWTGSVVVSVGLYAEQLTA